MPEILPLLEVLGWFLAGAGAVILVYATYRAIRDGLK
jgi:hypothetical protein